MIHGPPPGAISPRGKVSVPGLERQQAAVQSFGLSGGPGFQMSVQGLNQVPEIGDECFAIIGESNGEGGHAWREADLTRPPPAEAMIGGRRGSVETMGGSGESATINDQIAWSYNGVTYEAGTLLRIVRVSAFHWAIVESPESIAGSGSAEVCIDCGDGEVKCFTEGSDGVFRPVDAPAPTVPPTVPGETPKQCYERCIAEGGTPEDCAAACDLPPGGDAPSIPASGDGGGGGGAGGGGFGGAP
jgi:hypothetical protein